MENELRREFEGMMENMNGDFDNCDIAHNLGDRIISVRDGLAPINEDLKGWAEAVINRDGSGNVGNDPDLRDAIYRIGQAKYFMNLAFDSLDKFAVKERKYIDRGDY